MHPYLKLRWHWLYLLNNDQINNAKITVHIIVQNNMDAEFMIQEKTMLSHDNKKKIPINK